MTITTPTTPATREHQAATHRFNTAERAASKAEEHLQARERWHNRVCAAFAADSHIVLLAARDLEDARKVCAIFRWARSRRFSEMQDAFIAISNEAADVLAAAADRAAAADHQAKVAAVVEHNKATRAVLEATVDPAGYARSQRLRKSAFSARADAVHAQAVLRAGCRIQAAAGEAGSPLAADIVTVMAVLKGGYLRRVHLAERAVAAADRAAAKLARRVNKVEAAS